MNRRQKENDQKENDQAGKEKRNEVLNQLIAFPIELIYLIQINHKLHKIKFISNWR